MPVTIQRKPPDDQVDQSAGADSQRRDSEREPWPPEVDLILSALEAARGALAEEDHRALPRLTHKVRGRVRLFSDSADDEARVIFTRDLSRRGVGFLSRSRFPLGYGGTLEFAGPDGQNLRLTCTVLRCREAAPGWYEGAVYFNRDQQFSFE